MPHKSKQTKNQKFRSKSEFWTSLCLDQKQIKPKVGTRKEVETEDCQELYKFSELEEENLNCLAWFSLREVLCELFLSHYNTGIDMGIFNCIISML